MAPTKDTRNPHAVALGRLGGRVGGKSRSAAKLRAQKENAAKGGRPKGAKDLRPRKSRKLSSE